ncbi:hypothetical protein GCM10011607_13380 [Shewanella inventionis]|uniref:Uncharacterized protein n=1 Tax=Shewanella inventionis TaxID=1738770 RepID=A0ABQ1IWR6_9GAMM|nr:hypothetical protein GCM10011607_13380 [Shewanella inventionis]
MDALQQQDFYFILVKRVFRHDMGTLLSLNGAYANAYTISVNAYTYSCDINADFRRNAKVALFFELVEG